VPSSAFAQTACQSTASIGVANAQFILPEHWSATRAARKYVRRGEAVPADVARRVVRLGRGALVDAAGALTDRGAARWRRPSECSAPSNRAHGEALMQAGEGTPGFVGWGYLLSPLHPAPDICDLRSTQILHGLGAGVYPDRQRTPWPADPNTLRRSSSATS
jgi:hypothetical protein